MDVIGVDRRARLPAAVPFVAGGLLLVGAVAAVELRDAGTVELRIVAAVPGPPATVDGPVQDAVVDVTLRNTGAYAVRLRERRLRGGGPVDRDPAPELAAGGTAVLAVRWRVLCAEVGSLFGPRALDVRVRPARGPARTASLALRPAVRHAFRRSASNACAP